MEAVLNTDSDVQQAPQPTTLCLGTAEKNKKILYVSHLHWVYGLLFPQTG